MRPLDDTEIIVSAAVVVGVIAIAFYIARRPGQTFAEKVGRTLVTTADNAAAGVVKGVGGVLGVPDTDAGDCSRALASGRWWDASFSCPAKDFMKGVFGSAPADTGPDNWDSRYWNKTGDYTPASPYEMPGVFLP